MIIEKETKYYCDWCKKEIKLHQLVGSGCANDWDGYYYDKAYLLKPIRAKNVVSFLPDTMVICEKCLNRIKKNKKVEK